VIQLLDYSFPDAEYKSALLSALAILDIQADNEWKILLNYTFVYSAIIKLACILIVLQAYFEREEEVNEKLAVLSQRILRKEALKHCCKLFEFLQLRVFRFITITSSEIKPTSLNWIFEARSYSFKICYTTAQGNLISYYNIQLHTNQISDMIYNLLSLAQQSFAEMLELLDLEALLQIN
ncbi:hypothetical protein M406DRAFT_260563, partial [Cryphonectria parasitica EP155]